MFKSITEEPLLKATKKPSTKLKEILKHNWEYGLKEWQQPFQTFYTSNYEAKPVRTSLNIAALQ